MIDDSYRLEPYPWERIPEETSAAYSAFIVYRDLGTKRSLRKAAYAYYEIPDGTPLSEVQGKTRNVERWSATHRWVQRAEKYDDHLQAQADAEDVAEIRTMRRRHIQMLSVVQSKVVSYLNSVSDKTLLSMSPDAMMRMLDLAIKNERLARGVPDAYTMSMVMQGEQREERPDANAEALARKLDAWLMSQDPENDVERGEPSRDDDDAAEDLPAAAATLPEDDDLPTPPAWDWGEEQTDDENPPE